MWRFLLRVTSVRFYLKVCEGKTQRSFCSFRRNGRKLFRVQTVKRWRGFWEVLAVFPFEGELS